MSEDELTVSSNSLHSNSELVQDAEERYNFSTSMAAMHNLLIDLPRAVVHYMVLLFLAVHDCVRIQSACDKREVLDDVMRNSVVNAPFTSFNEQRAVRWIKTRSILVTSLYLNEGVTEESIILFSNKVTVEAIV